LERDGMANYYFLAASLPPLALGLPPELSFEELAARLQLNLTKKDQEQAAVLRRFIDLGNIRSLLLEEPIDPRGNLSEKELDEALLIQNVLPAYVFEFLNRYDSVQEKLRYFSGLFAQFFVEEIPKQKGFLKRYLSFEREWRLVMTALRAKQMGRDVAQELQFEEFTDPLVAQILTQRDAERYDPPVEYADIKEKFESCGPDPWQQHRLFAAWRFSRIDDLVRRPLFTIDFVLAYMAKLIAVEDWNELDGDRGRMILDTFKTGI
jgi:hypothetical protein